MATVTKSIGTSSRDYSTISAWEADLNDESIYSNGDTAVGEMYADSTFTGATTTIDGGSAIGGSAAQDLALVKLTVHADSRHDGTAESGVLLKPTADSGHDQGIIRINVDNVIVEWLDISLDSLDSKNTNKAIVLTGTNDDCILRNMLIHDKGGNPGDEGPCMVDVVGAGASSDTLTIQNNIIYNVVETDDNTANGIKVDQWAGTVNIYNNTIYNINSHGSNTATAYMYNGNSNQTANVKNNIAAKLVADNTTNQRAFVDTGTGTANEDYNLSDDTIGASANKATGSNSLVDKTLAQIDFVSTVAGSEDLHISQSSVCIGEGVDLGTTNGVEIDINGRDRDAKGDTWDIGAHEFTAVARYASAFVMFVD